jgi:hypothetical protein
VERYRDIDGDSGVTHFEIGPNWIKVWFNTNWYLYTYASAGLQNIEQMKKLAKAGDGLNAFINKYVKKRYESKGS